MANHLSRGLPLHADLNFGGKKRSFLSKQQQRKRVRKGSVIITKVAKITSILRKKKKLCMAGTHHWGRNPRRVKAFYTSFPMPLSDFCAFLGFRLAKRFVRIT